MFPLLDILLNLNLSINHISYGRRTINFCSKFYFMEIHLMPNYKLQSGEFMRNISFIFSLYNSITESKAV